MWQDLLTTQVTVVIVTGILTLLTSIVTSFFTARHDRKAQVLRAELAQKSAQDSLQADLIKQFVDSPRTLTIRENLRFLADVGLLPTYASGIKNYLKTSPPDAAPQLGDKFEFSTAGERVSEIVAERIHLALGIFKGFLEGKGFNNLREPRLFVYSKDKPPPQQLYDHLGEKPNSCYSLQRVGDQDVGIFIHLDLSSDVSVALREYTHYALIQSLGYPASYLQTEVESALADYLPATFLNSSAFGSNLPKNIGLDTRSFRNIDTDQSYDAVPPDWFSRGIVWAAALWSCRQRSSRGVDDLILSLWRQAMVTPDDEQLIVQRFGAALAVSPLGECFIQEMSRRNLPWNSTRYEGTHQQ